MRNLIPLLLIFFIYHLPAQNFTWIRGSNTISPVTNYGAKGFTGSAHGPGGRHGAATWTDKNGNMWLFGGEGYGNSNATTCWLNDLWKYDPLTNLWTWMQGDSVCNTLGKYGTMGVSSPTVTPGGREFAQCWTDTAGVFWLLGGAGYSSTGGFSQMNDLWKYNPSNNQWTWIGGSNLLSQNGIYGTQGSPSSSNFPGARQSAGTWVGKDGHLYLFGGRGYGATGPAQFLNDLWRYNIATNQWTWIHGTNLIGQPGVYGTLGVPAPTNMPGGKEFPASWIDDAGMFYLFGGRGAGYFNDLWKYNVVTNNWTWIHGANTANQKGLYGTMGVPSSTTVPGGRLNNHGWTDPSGDLWLFGGQGWSATTLNLLNDLWRYDPCSNQWTWMKGSDTTNRLGVYGTIGQTATTNMPGSRTYISFWTDKNGKPWFIGGEGFDAGSVSIGHMNDLWNIQLPKRSDTLYASQNNVCSGNTVTLSVNSAFSPITWYAYSAPQVPVASGTTFITPTLTAVTPTTVSYLAQINCLAKPKSTITVSIQSLPSVSLTSAQPTICSGSSVMLTAAGAQTYTMGTANGSGTFIVTPSSTVTYTVIGAGPYGCTNTATLTEYVTICVGIDSFFKSSAVTIYPNPTRDQLTILLNDIDSHSEFYLYDLQGKLILNKTISVTENTISFKIVPGFYLYRLTSQSTEHSGKLIIQ